MRQLHAVTQGSSLDEVAENLKEAVAIALEDEEPGALGLVDAPVIVVTVELETAVA